MASDLKKADTEALADELISRLTITEREARQLKRDIMRAAGFKVRRSYVYSGPASSGRDDEDEDWL